MKKSLGFLMILPLLMCSCAHTNWNGADLTKVTPNSIGNGPRIIMGAAAEPYYHILWPDYGHFNTAGLVAKFAGHDDRTASRIAYFSQAPDNVHDLSRPSFFYNAAIVGIWASFIPPAWGYRLRIEDTLHSLHGGNPSEVTSRQQKLEQLVAERNKSNESEHWKLGFLIHALGDSYAHVFVSTNGGQYAYGPLVGHVLDGGSKAVRPDHISQHTDNYTNYTRALFRALDGKADRAPLLEAFLGRVSEAARSHVDPDCAESAVKAVIQNEDTFPTSQAEIVQSHKEWRAEIRLCQVDGFLRQVKCKLCH